MISDIEKTAFEEFEKVGDDGLFPNHTDKDIWISGFTAGALWELKGLDDFLWDMAEDYQLWDEEEKGLYPSERMFEAIGKWRESLRPKD